MILFWMARLGSGPTPSVIARMHSPTSLVDSKLLLLEANAAVLTRVQVVFTLQIGLTIAGIVVLSLALWPLP
jgi:hypothetical protein